MPALYPSSLPLAGAAITTQTLAQAGHTAIHNNGADESRAIATKIGTGASTPTANTFLRGNGVGTSAWSTPDISTADVTGTLPVSKGGTGTTTSTGTNNTVLSDSPTLTTPTINSPTVTTPTMTGGGSWAGSPTITTPTIASFTNAQHDHTNVAGGGALGAATVGATNLTTSAITLGYAEITADFTANPNTSYVDITGLTTTVTVPSGGRRIKITAWCTNMTPASGTPPQFRLSIRESSTVLAETTIQGTAAVQNSMPPAIYSAVTSPGSHTYKVSFNLNQNANLTLAAGTTFPAFILVEAI